MTLTFSYQHKHSKTNNLLRILADCDTTEPIHSWLLMLQFYRFKMQPWCIWKTHESYGFKDCTLMFNILGHWTQIIFTLTFALNAKWQWCSMLHYNQDKENGRESLDSLTLSDVQMGVDTIIHPICILLWYVLLIESLGIK